MGVEVLARVEVEGEVVARAMFRGLVVAHHL